METNEKLNEFLVSLIKDEHATSVTDVLVNYINEVMLNEEKEELIERVN